MKFAYKVPKSGNNFILIFRFEDIDLERMKDNYSYFIFDEKELAIYIKSNPNCYSLVADDDCEKEAKRLYKKYGLKNML